MVIGKNLHICRITIGIYKSATLNMILETLQIFAGWLAHVRGMRVCFAESLYRSDDTCFVITETGFNLLFGFWCNCDCFGFFIDFSFNKAFMTLVNELFISFSGL